MNTEQENNNMSDTAFHIKSVFFMCVPCNRRFCIISPENEQGTCPRCDQVSTVIVNDEDHENKPTETHESESLELRSPILTQNQPQEQSQTESQAEQSNNEPTMRLFRIVRRIIFRTGSVIVIETVIPIAQENPQSELPSPAFSGANTSENAENQSQENTQPQSNPFAGLLEFLLLGQMMNDSETSGFDRFIEEFLRNDPNKHGPAPATEENINALNEFEFDQEKAKFTQCSVCQEDYNQGEKCLGLPCEHDYHKDCITEWLKLHDSCPVCRKAISPSKETPKESTEELFLNSPQQ